MKSERINIMNAKSSNLKYIIFIMFIIVAIILFIVFFTVKQSENKSVDYNNVLQINGYVIKISNANYLTDKKQLMFVLSSKLSEDVSDNNIGEKPELQSVDIYYKRKHDSIKEKAKIKRINSISQTITFDNIDNNIEYVEVIIISKSKDYYEPDTTDEFGAKVKGKKVTGNEEMQLIVIDKSDIEFTKSDQFKLNIDVNLKPETSKVSFSDRTTTVTAKETVTTSKSSKKKTTTKKSITKATNSKRMTTKSKNEVKPSSDELVSTVPDNYNEVHTQITSSSLKTLTTQNSKRSTASKKETENKSTTTKKKSTVKSDDIKVNSISLKTGFADNNVQLSIGKKHTVSAIILPTNANDKTVTWISNRPDIAEVNSSGQINAISSGYAIITAKSNDGGLTASCMVTVTK